MPNVKKNKEKEIPVKNYLIIGVIIIVTIIACVYLFSWFRQYNNSRINSPIITSTLREVEYNNLNTVLQERDVLIVYMCTTDEDVCRSFEKKFASYVKDNNLTEEIIYLNLGYNKDDNNLLNTIYTQYKSDNLLKKVYGYPTLLIFSDSKIVDVLSSNDGDSLTIKDVENFLEGYDL